MIRFESASPLPRVVSATDLIRAGRELGRTLRLRHGRTIGLRFVTPRVMRRLNHLYRRTNRVTDVLSFIATEPSWPSGREIYSAGDIAICPAYAIHEAKRRGIQAREEIVRLLVHGTLHLWGFNHATAHQEARMFREQERLVERILS